MAQTQASSKTVTFTLISQPTGDPYTGLSQADLDTLIKETLTREFRTRGIAISVAVTSA